MNLRLKKMILASIFSAMSIILYLFIKFPLPIFPSFLEVNFSMLPIAIAGFSLGPIYGLVCVVLRFIGKLIFMGTSSVYVGEIMDLVIGVVVVLAISIPYKFIKLSNNKKSVISLLCGLLFWVISSSLLNVFYAVPAYIKLFFGGNVNTFVGAISGTIKGVNESNYLSKYLFYAVIPFNLLLAFFTLSITFLVHLKIRKLYDEDFDNQIDDEDDEQSKI